MCTLEEAQMAYESQDYDLAYTLFLRLAEGGDTEAQSSVGGMLYWGLGVAPSAEKAVFWYEQAASSGNLIARNNLAMILLDSGPEVAMPWLLTAANDGSPFCQSSLGDIYSGCYNFPKEIAFKYSDDAVAIEWYSKASENGLASADHRLGEMYLAGQGCEPDVEKAILYFLKAAERDYKPSLEFLSKAYREGVSGVEIDEEKASFWNSRLREIET
ncbi:MAG: tetratricopeptide repeat protein [Cyanobacteria bacterium P01_G01_bin.54]